MSPPPHGGILQALSALNEALRELDKPAMVIGGIAVIAHGVPRSTVDVDATVWGADVSLEDLFEALEAHQIVPRIPDAEGFARRRQVLLVAHQPSGTPLEVSLGWLPFEREALERAFSVDFGGLRIVVPQVEDLVVYKAVAWRDRDKQDIQRLLLLHADEIDLHRLRDIMGQFAEALDEPERVGELEALIRETLDEQDR